jgi:hypothetical protein
MQANMAALGSAVRTALQKLGDATRHLHAGDRLRIGAAIVLLAAAAAALFLSLAQGSPARQSDQAESPPGPPPKAPALLLKDIDPKTAMEINSKLPFSTEPNPPARSFAIRGDDLAYMRALECLTSTIYYEAANESTDGQRAVAQVVLNRVRHPAFPPSVCAVTYEGSLRDTGCQFSFTCDGALGRTPHPVLWARARAVAAAALGGEVFAPVGNATHYHANYVVPYWATSLAKNAVVGTHIFYRWMGWWGQPPAFRQPHSGQEPDPVALRHAALRRRGRPPEQQLPLGTDPRLELVGVIHLLASLKRPEPEAAPADKKPVPAPAAPAKAVPSQPTAAKPVPPKPPAEKPVAPKPPPSKKKPVTYEDHVHAHFGQHSEHLAVQIYRQLQAANPRFAETAIKALMHYSAPPELQPRGLVDPDVVKLAGGAKAYDGFITALRDFVKHSGFQKFYEDRQPFYSELQQELREPTLQLLAQMERERTGPKPEFRLLLAPLIKGLSATGCEPLTRSKSAPWLLIALGDPPDETFDKHPKLLKNLVDIASAEPSAQPRTCSQFIRRLDVPATGKSRR